VAWGFGDQRSFAFEIRARQGDTDDWDKIYSGESSGSTTGIEQYNVDDTVAEQAPIGLILLNLKSTVPVALAAVVAVTVVAVTAVTVVAATAVTVVAATVVAVVAPTAVTVGADDTINVPGLIQAENFSDYQDNDSNNRGGQYRDTGVDIQNCSDSNCGFNVGWMDSGEWLEYDINVTSSGSYNAQLRVARRCT